MTYLASFRHAAPEWFSRKVYAEGLQPMTFLSFRNVLKVLVSINAVKMILAQKFFQVKKNFIYRYIRQKQKSLQVPV